MGETVKIVDDCLAPFGKIKLFYKGKNPLATLESVDELFKPYFRISTSRYNLELFNWDISGKIYEFYEKWWMKKELSGYTTMELRYNFQGIEDSETHEGSANIEITSHLYNEFPENWIAKGFWWLYQYFFYDKVRRQYLLKCRELTEGFREILKAKFGLVPTPAKLPEQYEFAVGDDE